jgi:hypothetical protein
MVGHTTQGKIEFKDYIYEIRSGTRILIALIVEWL